MAKRSRDRVDAFDFVDPDFERALEDSAERERARGRHAEHKTRQLCRQVQRALNLALATGFTDDDLCNLFVVDVSPAPGCGHLLAHVVVPDQRTGQWVLSKLREHTPRVRTVVARSISRKRAPELSFVQALAEDPHD